MDFELDLRHPVIIQCEKVYDPEDHYCYHLIDYVTRFELSLCPDDHAVPYQICCSS